MSNGCPLRSLCCRLPASLGSSVPFATAPGVTRLAARVCVRVYLRRAARQPPEPADHGAKGGGIPPHKPKACKPWKDLPCVCGTFAAGRSNGLLAFRLSSHFILCPWAPLVGKFSAVPFSDHAAEKQQTVGRRQACNIRAFAARRLKRILKMVFLRISGNA